MFRGKSTKFKELGKAYWFIVFGDVVAPKGAGLFLKCLEKASQLMLCQEEYLIIASLTTDWV